MAAAMLRGEGKCQLLAGGRVRVQGRRRGSVERDLPRWRCARGSTHNV